MSYINPGSVSGAGGTAGTATINFGSFPGAATAQIVVTGQSSILNTSQVTAWISLNTATSDHSEDEHEIENFTLRCGTIVPGTGFTIYGQAESPVGNNLVTGNLVYGQWTISWFWK